MIARVLESDDSLLSEMEYYFTEFNRIVENNEVESIPYLLSILKEPEIDIEDLIRLEALFTIKALMRHVNQAEKAYIEAEIKQFDEELFDILKSI